MNRRHLLKFGQRYAVNGRCFNDQSNLNKNLERLSKENKVPIFKISRLASYGGIAWNLFKDKYKGGEQKLSNQTIDDIVAELCKLRGAALKFGQFISIQDDTIVSKEVRQIFDRVRQHADYMPWYQANKVLTKAMGKDWKSKFKTFDTKPIAAASIGQVHRARTITGDDVAVKVQYPGVADSITNDLQTLSFVLNTFNIIPKSYFVNSSLNDIATELLLETDYCREAQNQDKFYNLLKNDDFFIVPKIHFDLSTSTVLTSDFVEGEPIDYFVNHPQEMRNKIGHKIMDLNLKELFHFGFMQTDPNWSNFFYNQKQDKLYLLDFGACREFSKDFIDTYIQIIYGASIGDKEMVERFSTKMGFLNGEEEGIMTEAHVKAVMTLGEPFRTPGIYDFADQKITYRIGELVPTMLKHRLVPPPQDTYSLHRKMSGVFLICAKLKSKVGSSELFKKAYQEYIL